MTRQFARAKSHPKISTMPCPASEATAHLEMYKLLVEKKRLQQELATLDQRRQQIIDRLLSLECQVADLEIAAHTLSQPSVTSALSDSRPKRLEPPAGEFDALFLEY